MCPGQQQAALHWDGHWWLVAMVTVHHAHSAHNSAHTANMETVRYQIFLHCTVSFWQYPYLPSISLSRRSFVSLFPSLSSSVLMHILFSSAILTWNEKQKTVFAPALCSPARRWTAVTEWHDSSAICQDRCHRVLCAQTQLLPYTCTAEQTDDRDDSHWRSSYSSLPPLGK